MKYYSTNKQSPPVGFKEAAIQGLAPDKGLYFPETIPLIDSEFLKNIQNYSNAEIAYKIIAPYIGDAIPPEDLKNIVEETLNFEFPLVAVDDHIFSLELYHGPTLAFKDVGARFMSRCFGYFAQEINKKIIVLVATSGDTGGAVADGFYNVESVDVVILYPSGKVSSVQEKQLTTLGNNIHALEVEGNFDDCQRIVKSIFMDEELKKRLNLTSANSINVARWLPQQFYYFFAWKQWKDKQNPPVISVPSGNFGNICAGLLAQRSGLSVKHFIAACNANDTVPGYMHSGMYNPQPAVATISNAMDVGDPSNFIRILELFKNDPVLLKKNMSACSITDEDTRKSIQDVMNEKKYLLDPHGAVAYTALKNYLAQDKNNKGIFLETAHPVKFYDVVEPVVNSKVPVPEVVKAQLEKEKKSIKIKADPEWVKTFLSNL